MTTITPSMQAAIAELRAAIAAEPDAPLASSTRDAGDGITVRMTRHGADITAELVGDDPVAIVLAHAAIHACGAPDGTPILSSAGGRIHRGEWTEDGYEPSGVGARAFYWRAHP